MRIRAYRSYTQDLIEAHLLRVDGFGVGARLFFCSELKWKEYKGGEMLTPSLSLDNSEAQELMDGLWQCGVRPTEGAGTAGSMAATKEHLKDLQRIAFGLLKQRGMKD